MTSPTTSPMTLDDFEHALKTFLSRNGKRKDLPTIMTAFMECSDVSPVFTDRTMQLHDICVRLNDSGVADAASVNDCWRYYWKTMFAQQVPSHSELDDFVSHIHQPHVQELLEMQMLPVFEALCAYAKENDTLLQQWISQMLDTSRTFTRESLYVHMFDTVNKKHFSFEQKCMAIDRIVTLVDRPSITTQEVIGKLIYSMRKRSGFLDWALDAQHDAAWWKCVGNACCMHTPEVSDEYPTKFLRHMLRHVDLMHSLRECQRIHARRALDNEHHLGIDVDFATRYRMAEFPEAFANIPTRHFTGCLSDIAFACKRDKQHDTFLDFVQHYVPLNGSTHCYIWQRLLRYPDDRVKGYAVLQMLENEVHPEAADYMSLCMDGYFPYPRPKLDGNCMGELVELFFDAKTRDPLLQLFISMPENVQIFKDWYATLTPPNVSTTISAIPASPSF